MPAIKTIETREIDQRSERRRLDLEFATKTGSIFLHSIPELQKLAKTDFSNANESEVSAAWHVMQAPYQALIHYYEHFPSLQPKPHEQTSLWIDVQPYASVSVWLRSLEKTLESLFSSRSPSYAQYYRSTFHELPSRLMRVIAADFYLPDSIFDSSLTYEQRKYFLSIMTGSDLVGLRFLPVYRKLFSEGSQSSYYEALGYPTVSLVWDPTDVTNRVIFSNGNRHYGIGSTGSSLDLEQLVAGSVIVRNVQQISHALPANMLPVFDVDDTLTAAGNYYRFSDPAIELLSKLRERSIPFLLWSRAEASRIDGVLNYIYSASQTAPAMALHMHQRAWPFHSISTQRGRFQFQADSKLDIESQIRSALDRIGLTPQEIGFMSLAELVNLVDEFIAKFCEHSQFTFEQLLQGKCPWFVALSELSTSLSTDVAKMLLTQGVLFDDRGVATMWNAHKLGFNFVHVPSSNTVMNASTFIWNNE